MTDEKLLQVVDALEGLLPPAEGLCCCEDHEHLRGMFPRLREIIAEGRREKAMRWVGFIQGAYWVMGAADLEDLKKMNMAEGVEYDAERR